MTNLINWNPFREFHHVTNQLSDLVYNGARSTTNQNESTESVKLTGSRPLTLQKANLDTG